MKERMKHEAQQLARKYENKRQIYSFSLIDSEKKLCSRQGPVDQLAFHLIHCSSLLN